MIVGDLVKCSLPGRRSFQTHIVALRPEQGAVDLVDPRNGGIRTVLSDTVKPVRRRRTKIHP